MSNPTLLKTLSALAIGAGVALTQTSANAASTDDAAAYHQAVDAGSLDALRGFLRSYPDSPLAASAFSRLTQLAQAPQQPPANEVAAYEEAMEEGTVEALREFLLLYPDSPLAASVRARLTQMSPPPGETTEDDFFAADPTIY